MQNEIVLVIGPKGSGKTYEVCRMFRQIERGVVFDIVHEAGYAEVILEANEDGNAVIIGQPKLFAQAIGKDREKFKVIYRPVEFDVKSNGLVYSDEFGQVTRLVFLRGDTWLIVDEAHLLCNSHNCPKELMIANLIGRHRRMSMVLVAQSFTGIHPAIRKNADTFLFWRIIEPSDLDAIRDRCGKDVADKVSQLRVLERDPKTDKLISPGQMLRWDKLRGIVEITNAKEEEPELERDRR